MPLPKPYSDVLKFLASKLTGQGINWAIIGSTNHAMQGVDAEPHDIDVLSDRQGAYKIADILKEYVVEPVKYTENESFSSYHCVLDIKGIIVEVMGEKENKPEIDLWGEYSNLSEKIYFDLDGWKIPAISLKREYFAYSKLGRKEKADLIKKALNP
jgi:hypothetical protein